MPTKVDVENCDRVPCILPRGGSLTNIIDFENRKCVVVWVKRKDLSQFTKYFINKADYSENLTLKTKWREIASGITGEFPFPSNIKNACLWLMNTQCPVYETEDVSYNLTMPVLKIYPPNLDLDLEISLWNDNNKPVTCFHVLTRTSS